MPTSLASLVRLALSGGPGSVRAAARLMSVVADQPQRLPEVYQATAGLDGGEAASVGLLPRLLVGITGAPGAGKSTLTDALIREYRSRLPDRRIGVVAVDPSSPFTGGAVLGDRVRMMRHAIDPMVFVRSMASRGHLGGLALGVKGVVRIMALLGCDVVIIETVGVGQSEVEVAGVADVVMIVLAPGQGDSIQLLKAGLMEIGDVFVVNKADRPDAHRLHTELLATLRIVQDTASPRLTRRPGLGTDPPTFLVSAEVGRGVEELVDGLERLAAEHSPAWQQHRLDTVAQDVRDAVLEEATRRIQGTLGRLDDEGHAVASILAGDLTVGQLTDRLLAETVRRRQVETDAAREPPRD
ncbi:MAG TPA: methylmalonyl Co-A mutase-associated GTPase MeaB [Vicinamibacterales bacterium]|jgi:LAO/AO transport system kinase